MQSAGLRVLCAFVTKILDQTHRHVVFAHAGITGTRSKYV
jgi:hypothetical protein